MHEVADFAALRFGELDLQVSHVGARERGLLHLGLDADLALVLEAVRPQSNAADSSVTNVGGQSGGVSVAHPVVLE